MERYDITKVDIFSLQNLKRGELSNMHSMLLFLYSKYHGNEEVSFKYSEISWLNYNIVSKTLFRLHELNLIMIVQRPTKQSPFVIKLKANSELHYILNKDRKLQFHLYEPLSFTRTHFKEALDCSDTAEHFIGSVVSSWIRNVNNEVWDLHKFLTITKIVSYFSCDYKIKTFTVNKYVSKKVSLNKAIKFLYEKIPESRKEILYSQFSNTLDDLKIRNDKSFMGMSNKYLEHLKKERALPCALQTSCF
ncbi:hypothetical protein N9948_00480 [bacterium]|nr:hypothetical protein [bacterium]